MRHSKEVSVFQGDEVARAVRDRRTLIRELAGGVVVGYADGTDGSSSIAAIVDPGGAFRIVGVTWDGYEVKSIGDFDLNRVDADGMTLRDSLGNLVASFLSSGMSIGDSSLRQLHADEDGLSYIEGGNTLMSLTAGTERSIMTAHTVTLDVTGDSRALLEDMGSSSGTAIVVVLTNRQAQVTQNARITFAAGTSGSATAKCASGSKTGTCKVTYVPSDPAPSSEGLPSVSFEPSGSFKAWVARITYQSVVTAKAADMTLTGTVHADAGFHDMFRAYEKTLDVEVPVNSGTSVDVAMDNLPADALVVGIWAISTNHNQIWKIGGWDVSGSGPSTHVTVKLSSQGYTGSTTTGTLFVQVLAVTQS